MYFNPMDVTLTDTPVRAWVETALTAQRYRIRRGISQLRVLDSAFLQPVCEVGRRRT